MDGLTKMIVIQQLLVLMLLTLENVLNVNNVQVNMHLFVEMTEKLILILVGLIVKEYLLILLVNVVLNVIVKDFKINLFVVLIMSLIEILV